MKTKQLLPLLVFTFFIGSCNTSKLAKSKQAPIESSFQAVLDSIFTKHPHANGIMVHVEAPDKNISWSGAVGYSDKNKSPIQPDQPAWIASNTKTYVSASILRLVEQGKLRLDQSISELLSSKTNTAFLKDGYQTDDIQLVHLLSHTSGIFDYVNSDDFFPRFKSKPDYRWTRDEQIGLALSQGAPLGPPGKQFSYADTNYSLLAEIIEQQTGKKYYTAIRELLNYKKHQLDATWFISQEPKPKNTKAFVHQYIGEMNIDSYLVDPSFDLFGGGGIAATTKDLARFSQQLFEGKLFDQAETLPLIYTEIKTEDKEAANYSLGLFHSSFGGKETYGHGGFWGTMVQYLPELNASVAVYILERDERKLRKDVLEGIIQKM